MRLIRIFDAEAGDLPVIYLERAVPASDAPSKGAVVVNGCTREGISLLSPGTLPRATGISLVVTDADAFVAGDFLAFPGEETLLRAMAEGSDALSLELRIPGFLAVSERAERRFPLRIGVLTVSDKGSRGERVDTAGPALQERASQLGGDVVARAIVPDERDLIAETVRKWAEDQECHLVLVTGGTGLSPRDVTPEALTAIGTREIPGIGEYMRWRTSFRTSRSILSRGGAIMLGRTLVLALPGSERGATECFDAVSSVLRHAVGTAWGIEGECGHGDGKRRASPKR